MSVGSSLFFFAFADSHHQDVKDSADGGTTIERKHTNKGAGSKSVSGQHEIGYAQVWQNYKA